MRVDHIGLHVISLGVSVKSRVFSKVSISATVCKSNVVFSMAKHTRGLGSYYKIFLFFYFRLTKYERLRFIFHKFFFIFKHPACSRAKTILGKMCAHVCTFHLTIVFFSFHSSSSFFWTRTIPCLFKTGLFFVSIL